MPPTWTHTVLGRVAPGRLVSWVLLPICGVVDSRVVAGLGVAIRGRPWTCPEAVRDLEVAVLKRRGLAQTGAAAALVTVRKDSCPLPCLGRRGLAQCGLSLARELARCPPRAVGKLM